MLVAIEGSAFSQANSRSFGYAALRLRMTLLCQASYTYPENALKTKLLEICFTAVGRWGGDRKGEVIPGLRAKQGREAEAPAVLSRRDLLPVHAANIQSQRVPQNHFGEGDVVIHQRNSEAQRARPFGRHGRR